MNKDNLENACYFIIFVFIILSIGFISGYFVGKSYGYKKGQIDAINGIIKYELIKQENGESKWKRIKDK
jgi:hypothetical protein